MILKMKTSDFLRLVPSELSKQPWIQFRWRPYVGADCGTWLSRVPTGEHEISVRGFGRVAVDVRLNWLAGVFKLNHF